MLIITDPSEKQVLHNVNTIDFIEFENKLQTVLSCTYINVFGSCVSIINFILFVYEAPSVSHFKIKSTRAPIQKWFIYLPTNCI